ncbi:MAG: helix-turn-helix domain-containing protein [Clostridia bacterium]
MEPEIVGKRIKKLMEIKNITSQQLSKKMDIDINSLNKKLEGQEEFYLDEMKKIQQIFDLDIKQLMNYFLKKNVKSNKIKKYEYN